ncbi:glycine/betaine ABC transporter substrate-binding protein [Salinirubellus salinus]|uniref:Glycine/betaine ABC transporter substrate-binding protein n=1 Tax=Salinirubellus salinus TaxID=1364945 RepID=A0A9E7R2B1_9EURY|nr:glycine betaine ABC transporter substrate-binding protein [Salinirubellus salinus]UWM53335.1 glycine/betaine ABC transporter substrate-binding protein [Salinirubellus salinus]
MTVKHTRRQVLKRGAVAGGAVGLTSLAGCSSFLGGGGTAVKVGSKQFTEQELLGHMAYEALDANADVEVVNEVGLGGTTTNFRAVKSDEIDLYWEYTGTAWATLPPKHDEVITDPQQIYQKVDEEVQSEHSLDFLQRAPFNNTYVLTANPDWVEQTGVETLSGFAEYVNGGNTDFTVVLNAEFENRADGWPGVAKHYGFDGALSDIQVTNVDSGLTYQTVGQGDAQVGVGFNTNPKIVRFDLTVLEDDEQFFPVYNPAPLVNQDALESAPSIEEPLNAIGPTLSTEKIRSLNKQVSIDGGDPQKTAREFLSNEGLI